MIKKRLFSREFWLLWSAGVLTSAIFAVLVRIPTTPLATFLLLRGHSQESLLVCAEAIEIPVEFAIVVTCGLLAAHRIGLGAPIVERWLRGEPIKSHVRSLLVPSLVVAILLAVVSMLPNLHVFHPNRQLAHQEAERISESPTGASLGQKLGRFTSGPLTLTSLTISYLSSAISGELISRLFLVSGIALTLAKVTGTPSGAVSDRILFSAVLAVAALDAIVYFAWQAATSQVIYNSLGVTRIVRDPFWSIIARDLLQTVPGAVGHGWLYVRRGLESAILSSFVAFVLAYVMFLVAVRLA
jgi:hypothetical protein